MRADIFSGGVSVAPPRAPGAQIFKLTLGHSYGSLTFVALAKWREAVLVKLMARPLYQDWLAIVMIIQHRNRQPHDTPQVHIALFPQLCYHRL